MSCSKIVRNRSACTMHRTARGFRRRLAERRVASPPRGDDERTKAERTAVQGSQAARIGSAITRSSSSAVASCRKKCIAPYRMTYSDRATGAMLPSE